ncbi:DUF1028 domain-containing protein [Actinokineospora sp. UTMC 2448]|uniref:DUF1028 domain-containing protein n=1 Tax=Actinokineospora sp. UTMC 2448 TaxID=2268449 RepID=UPI0021640E57|nr:DUF1028 domain-containing protein [Actinokineospora sp. UTMC 2448]UVS82054.1 hypothetical protein Actkin_05819 [Actinokineospora sp. UTMC 2448]
MTYSIVARDEETGCLGVAVQSGVLAIGTRVADARAGVGAVVAQAGSELTWRTMLLDLMASGMTAAQAVAAVATLPGAEESQFAAVGVDGDAAAYTGPGCIPEAGHATQGPVSAQANMMAAPTVWQAMLAASSPAPFAERLVAALAAAEREGGDVRGPQSAALLVVGPTPGAQPTGYPDDPVVDLRVDDSRDPVGDLARLLRTARAHRHLIRAHMTDDPDELRAAVALAPDDPTALRAAGITLALRGFTAEARPLLARALDLEPRIARWARVSAERAMAEGNPHAATLLGWL